MSLTYLAQLFFLARYCPREKGVATIFGGGDTITNYIAVDDVAEFAVKILSRPEVVNEAPQHFSSF